MLFLRPTESATLFLQQLGRGLRRTREKAVLTVLGLCRAPPQRVPVRPSAEGSHRADPPWTRTRHRTRLPVPPVGLPNHHGPTITADRAGKHPQPSRATAGPRSSPNCDPTVIRTYEPFCTSQGSSFPTCCVTATPGRSCGARPGSEPAPAPKTRRALLKRIRAFAHIDDPAADADVPSAAATTTRSPTRDLSTADQRIARMLFFSLWPDGGTHESVDVGLMRLRARSGSTRRTTKR